MTLSAISILNENDKITFKLELIDASTDVIIGSYDNVEYTRNIIFQYKNLGYEVNTEGIGNRIVKLRLILESNFDAFYALSLKYSTNNLLLKKYFKQINYQGSLEVKDYNLSQNYPNPFNPITTIYYQIPKGEKVTLKVYDILGNEVSTLVEEYKEKGRYTATFDGSKLSSGVYIYSLVAGEYKKTNKMMLLK